MSVESHHKDGSVVGLAIAAWFDAVDRGQALDREEFLKRHPEIANELRQFFADYDSFRANADMPAPPQLPAVNAGPELQPTIKAPSDVGDTVAASARYRELQFFKKGGLGTLFRAFDEALHRETIVKFLSDKCIGDPALLTQFRVEAEITARLDHPGVVPVYGIGEAWSGRPFYVMRLVKGRELSQAIQEYHSTVAADPQRVNSRQQLFTLLEHLVRACNTVAYAHDVGIIHCDLKPSNIMTGRYGETFVLDWGLATSFERTTNFFSSEPTMRPGSASGSSASGQRGGTYGYVSPEQLTPDQSIGPTSDVYSLGATLYEILTGVPPFNGRDKDVIEQIRTGRFRLPREVKKDIPWRLAAICRKAMRLRPEGRYATAKQLAADLTNWMRDEEVQAAPDRWTDRIARFSRRHRALTAVTLIATLVIAGAAAWTDRATKLAAHEQELRALENKNNQLVKTSFTTALDTFEDLCRPLANGEMNNLGIFRPFADKINTFAKQYLEDYETTPSMALHTGRVYELRATVSRVLSSDTTQALEYYHQAEEIYRGGQDAGTDPNELARRLAHIHLSQGQLYIQRHAFQEAEETLVKARETLERQSSQHSDDNGLQRDLAEVYHSLGEMYLNQNAESAARYGALLESQNNFEKSKLLRERLKDNSSGAERRNHQRDLARSLGYLGDLDLAQGNIAQAAADYDRSKDLREELHRTNPADPEHRFQYARGLKNFSYLERDYRGKLNDAIETFKAAQSLQAKLADDFPDVAKFRRDLGATLNGLAEVYLLEATANPEKTVEYRDLAYEAAVRAGNLFGDFVRAGDKKSDSESVHGLARSYVLRSIFNQLTGGNQTVELARDAQELLLTNIGREPELGRTHLVTLALSRSLQGQPDAAFLTLKDAIDRGENTVNRFDRHRAAGFRAIAEHPVLGPQFDKCCRELKAKLNFQ